VCVCMCVCVCDHVTDLEVFFKVKLETNELLDVGNSKRGRTEKKMAISTLSTHRSIVYNYKVK